MNEKQQIEEAERRFENWWDAEGSENLDNIDDELYLATAELYKLLIKEAWMNGAFVARENN